MFTVLRVCTLLFVCVYDCMHGILYSVCLRLQGILYTVLSVCIVLRNTECVCVCVCVCVVFVWIQGKMYCECLYWMVFCTLYSVFVCVRLYVYTLQCVLGLLHCAVQTGEGVRCLNLHGHDAWEERSLPRGLSSAQEVLHVRYYQCKFNSSCQEGVMLNRKWNSLEISRKLTNENIW